MIKNGELEITHPELQDYKFFCFNGKCQFFKIDFDRFTNHKANYYSRDRKLLPFYEQILGADFEKKLPIPLEIESMIELAEKLAIAQPFARIDLYDVNGKIYFGEITFYPSAGFGLFEPAEWNYKIGDMIYLPNRLS